MLDKSTDLTDAKARPDLAAQALNTPAPARLLDDDGAPAADLLDFARRHGLSLDWIFCGDVKPLLTTCSKWGEIESGDMRLADILREQAQDIYREASLAAGLASALDLLRADYLSDRQGRESEAIRCASEALERVLTGLAGKTGDKVRLSRQPAVGA